MLVFGACGFQIVLKPLRVCEMPLALEGRLSGGIVQEKPSHQSTLLLSVLETRVLL